KPFEGGLILSFDHHLPTPLVQLPNVDFASQIILYRLLVFLGVFGWADLGFAVDEECQLGSVLSRRPVRLLRSFFVSSFSTTRSAMAMSFPTPTFSSRSSRSRKSAQFLGRSDLLLFCSLRNLLLGEA